MSHSLFLIRLLLISLLTPPLSASTGTLEPPQASPTIQSAREPVHTFIWKVSKGGKTLFLGGSIHLLRPQDMPMPPQFRQVFDESDECYFELDPIVSESPKAAFYMQQKGLYQGDDHLRKNITSQTAEKLDEFLTAKGYPSETFNKMRPWFLAMSLMMIEAIKSGADPALGVENQINAWAKQTSKPVKALETFEEQIDFFDSLPPDVQDNLLLTTILEMEEVDEFFDQCVAAWKQGDTETLNHLMGESLHESPVIHEVLVVQRNKNWIPKIEEALQSGKTAFVVVGAAHLTGKDGLIDLLQKKGYTVEQF